MRSDLAKPASRTALVVVLALAGLVVTSAEGSPPSLRLERIDARRCAADSTLQVHAAELTLDGVLRRRPPSEYRLLSPDGVLAKRPTRAQTFAEAGEALALAIVLQTTSAYGSALAAIKSALLQAVRALPPKSRVSLIVYDWEARRLVSAGSPTRATQAIEQLTPSDSAIDPALLSALSLGLDTLTARDGGGRRLLLVISDGLDQQPDRNRFRGLGSRAARLGIAIFPLAYSPIDERGPLLNLGELAKRSHGTFRWARTAQQIASELQRFGREIAEQPLLTYRVPSCALDAPLRLAAGALVSNELAVTQTGAVEAPSNSAPTPQWLRYLVFGCLLLAALVVLLLAARWLLRTGR